MPIFRFVQNLYCGVRPAGCELLEVCAALAGAARVSECELLPCRLSELLKRCIDKLKMFGCLYSGGFDTLAGS